MMLNRIRQQGKVVREKKDDQWILKIRIDWGNVARIAIENDRNRNGDRGMKGRREAGRENRESRIGS